MGQQGITWNFPKGSSIWQRKGDGLAGLTELHCRGNRTARSIIPDPFLNLCLMQLDQSEAAGPDHGFEFVMLSYFLASL